MALDEPKGDDERHEVDGLTFVVRPLDLKIIGAAGVHLDYVDNFLGRGFLVSPGSGIATGCS